MTTSPPRRKVPSEASLWTPMSYIALTRPYVRNVIKMTRMGSRSQIDFIVAMERTLIHIWAAGYRSVHKAVVSDHILLWVDLDLKAFVGGQFLSITTPQAREFSFNNTEMREKLLEQLNTVHTH